MLNRKILDAPSVSKLNINLTSFESGIVVNKYTNILPIKYATNTYNFDFLDGSLKQGVGFEAFKWGKKLSDGSLDLSVGLNNAGRISRVWYYKKWNYLLGNRDDKLVFFMDDKSLKYLNLNDEELTVHSLPEIIFTSEPVATCYRLNSEDVIIFSSPTDNMVVWDGENAPYEVVDAPHITSMALHYERLFATTSGEKSTLWFSDDLDPTNWNLSLDEAGFIEMVDERGELLKVVSFSDYIYVFRQFGIARVSAYAVQESFSVSQLFVSSGKIYPETVCVCGDLIIFLAEDGLYYFNGIDTRKILSNVTPMFDGVINDNARSCYCNGKYYLTCRLKFDDCFTGEESQLNNALIVIDINRFSFLITRFVDVVSLTSLSLETGSIVIACVNSPGLGDPSVFELNDSGDFLGTPLMRVWESPFTDFGYPNKRKVARSITLTTTDNIEIIVSSENESRKYLFKGAVAPQSKAIKVYGKRFKFRLQSNSPECRISNLNLVFKQSSSLF